MEENKNLKKNFIWNIIGTTFNAFNSLFFMIIATRINGLNDAGIFTIAFSTACMFYVVAMYAGRIYQVTETNKSISNKEFIINRIITCILMLILTIGFVLIKGYNLYKILIFILLGLYKCIEAFSDSLYGILQKEDLLHIVGKSYLIKALSSLIIFIIIDIITKNLVLSCIGIVFSWVLITSFYDIRKASKYIDFKQKTNTEGVKKIFKDGFLVFAITFFSLYIINATKYAIDNYSTENTQAIFGIIIMPATVISLLAQFLLHPYLTKILNLYENKKFKELKKLMYKIIICIILLGTISAIVAYLFGVPVLEYIYKIQLGDYKILLTLIIIGATIYNVGIICSSILTTIRKNLIQFIIYVIVSIFAVIIANILTIKYEITGATIAYLSIMILFSLLYTITTIIVINKNNVENKEKKI